MYEVWRFGMFGQVIDLFVLKIGQICFLFSLFPSFFFCPNAYSHTRVHLSRSDLSVGIVLAVSSSIFIGSSFIIKKKVIIHDAIST